MWLFRILLKLSRHPKDHMWSRYLKCTIILHWICTFLSPELLLYCSYIKISRWRVFPQAGSKCYSLPEIEFYDWWMNDIYDEFIWYCTSVWSFSTIVIPACFIQNNSWINKIFKDVFNENIFPLFTCTFYAKRLFSVWSNLTVHPINYFAICVVFHPVCCRLLTISFADITQRHPSDTHWPLLDSNLDKQFSS